LSLILKTLDPMNHAKHIFLLVALLLTTNCISQVGVKLGVHSFDLKSPREIVASDTAMINYNNAELGFQGGLYGKIGIKNFFIETRAMFHSTKVSYTINGDNGGIVSNIRNETFTNLDIPLLFGFDLLFVDAFLGPVAHLHLDSTSDIIDFNGYETRFKTAEYGFRAGFGINIDKVNISLEYEGNFSNFGDHITIGGQQFNFGEKPSRILLNLGFKIF